MKALRVYLDTSVIGGCFDEEFERWSNALVQDFRVGRFRPVLSEVTAAEVLAAPGSVQALYAELLDLGADVLRVTAETLDVRAMYSRKGILGRRYENDLLHIAIATVGEVDVVVSWNFKHIVRLDKIRLFNAVNIEQGYKALTIYSPREVTIHGREDNDQSS